MTFGSAESAALANRTSAVEHHSPLAVRLQSPDRSETADQFALRVLYRPAAQGKFAGIENLDDIGIPGERRGGAFEESLPSLYYGAFAAQRRLTFLIADEDRFAGEKSGEPGAVALRHGSGESPLGFRNLVAGVTRAGLRPGLRRQAADPRQQHGSPLHAASSVLRQQHSGNNRSLTVAADYRRCSIKR